MAVLSNTLPVSEHVYGCDCAECAAAMVNINVKSPTDVPASGEPAAYSASAAALPNYISALLYPSDWRWNADSAHGTGVTVTYSFMTQAPSGYSGFSPFSATEKQAARDALAEWSKVANITFKEVSSGGQIAFGDASLGGPSGYTTWSGTRGKDSGYKTTHADVLMNGPMNMSYEDGSFGMRALLHEIGHALGLKHSFDTVGTTLSGVQNTAQYTVMSYDNAPSTPNAQPYTPQLYDIAAIQYLYGANRATNSGNTTYSWSTSGTSVMTIWDGGGVDTISAANQTRGATIDLREGQFSSIGSYGSGAAKNNIAVAYGSVIEKAVGSAQADTIIGNAAANVLVGGAGADKLTGGAGADIFGYAAPSEGGDTITDFASGTDRIAFDAQAFGISAGTLAAAKFVTVSGTYTGTNGSGTEWSAGRSTFIFDSSGNLYFDSNGKAAGYSKIALVQGSSLKASDIFLADDVLALAGGTSTTPAPAPTPTPTPAPTTVTVNGTNGNDTLSGVGGEKTLVGKLGNDTYIIDSAGDKVVEASNQGVDTVKSSVSHTLGTYVENLILTGSKAIDGTGSFWHNQITGNSAANTLRGLAGNDVLTGGGGADTFRYESTGDITWAKSNLTKGSLKADTITDFTSGTDKLSFDDQAFNLSLGLAKNGVNFSKISGAYNGTNATSSEFKAGHASLVVDGTNTVYYDPNGKGAGYYVVATLQNGANIHASDIIIA